MPSTGRPAAESQLVPCTVLTAQSAHVSNCSFEHAPHLYHGGLGMLRQSYGGGGGKGGKSAGSSK
jgi:hypothetical protein